MNICLPIRKHCTPFSDTVRVHNMFTIDRNKSLVNFAGSDVLRLQKPNHASHLHSRRGVDIIAFIVSTYHTHNVEKVCSTNCTRQLSTLCLTHHMTHRLKLNNCAGCMRKRSLLSRCPTYFILRVTLIGIHGIYRFNLLRFKAIILRVVATPKDTNGLICKRKSGLIIVDIKYRR